MNEDNPWLSWEYVADNWPELLAAGREHLGITIAAIALACALAVPLALWARRVPRLAGPIVATSGVLYTIPSLALISAAVAGVRPVATGPW